MGHLLQPVERQEAAGALDRVDRPENAGQQLLRPGLLFQRHKITVQLVQVLVALHEKLLDDVAQLVQGGPLSTPAQIGMGVEPTENACA